MKTLLVALAFPLCALAQPAGTLDKLQQSGAIRIGHRESSVPHSYLDGTRPVGFSMDICQKVVDDLRLQLKRPDLKVEFIPVTSANRIPLVQNGTVDLECGSTTNNSQRQQQVGFAVNTFYTGTRLLAKKSSPINGYADLKGKPVVSTSGTTNLLVMRKYSADKGLELSLMAAKDHADAFLMVDAERAVAFAMDDILLYGLVANARNPGDWKVVGEALQVEPYSMMLRKDDPAFKSAVDGTIKRLMASGEFETIYRKWFLQPIPPRNAPLNVPMSDDLRRNIRELSDKPAV
ncbi:MAG TPA: transporter substrate-binding domain-containing protein [Ramlibacter sp.]|nr:transporter substrate-binding domain-containing protein [Ramlibacter sp.]